MGEDKREIKREITQEIISMLKNGSCRMEIVELLKLGADSIKNSTYRTLLDSDMEYKQIQSEAEAVKNVLQQMNLQEDQREAIEQFADKVLEAEYHVVTNAYMAGILDGYKILKSFDLTYE
ncbi:MAG: hypothetical protein ACOX8H_07290 [Ruminococcus sp.]|jgi:hypothetical protein